MKLAQANLVTKTDFDAKMSRFNRKITKNKTDHLLVKNELTTLKNKIPDVSSLIKQTDYNTKIVEIDTKVSTYYEFNVDYRYLNPTEFDKNIPIIHNYFMLKYDIK